MSRRTANFEFSSPSRSDTRTIRTFAALQFGQEIGLDNEQGIRLASCKYILIRRIERFHEQSYPIRVIDEVSLRELAIHDQWGECPALAVDVTGGNPGNCSNTGGDVGFWLREKLRSHNADNQLLLLDRSDKQNPNANEKRVHKDRQTEDQKQRPAVPKLIPNLPRGD